MKNQRLLLGYFINPGFQLRFILYCLIFNVALTVLFFFAANHFFRQFEAMGRSAGFPPEHVFYSFISKQEVHLYTNMGWSAAVIFVLATIFGAFFSHKIAGPLQRLMSELKDMQSKKKLSAIQFRQGDYFPEISSEFNAMVKAVGGAEGSESDGPKRDV